MVWLNIVNMVAVIVAPIVAVWVGQKLQDVIIIDDFEKYMGNLLPDLERRSL